MIKIVDLNQTTTNIESQLPLVIGSFDVIHKGHAEIFKRVHKEQFNVLLVINSPKTITLFNTLNGRIKTLINLNPNAIYYFDVSKNNLSAEDFISKILLQISPIEIIVGDDFKFGNGVNGNVDTLKKHFNVFAVPKNDRYQTSIIKDLYTQGNVETANQLLEYPVWYSSKIAKGKQVGRLYKYPTINLLFRKKGQVFPQDGVYATKLLYKEKQYKGATYIKHINNLTSIETYVLNKRLPYDNYGELVSVSFLAKLNPIKEYPKKTMEQKNQVAKMVRLAKAYFGFSK